jgi:hypothetical protein
MPIRVLSTQALFLTLAFGITGCGPKQPDFPELVPVKGVVKKGKETVTAGIIQFEPETPRPAFLIQSFVAPDGTYSLVTTRTTDTVGENRPGAPAGKYKVTYLRPLGEKPPEKGSKGGPPPGPIRLGEPVTVSAGQADYPIDLTKGMDILQKIDSKTDTKKGGPADSKQK